MKAPATSETSGRAPQRRLHLVGCRHEAGGQRQEGHHDSQGPKLLLLGDRRLVRDPTLEALGAHRIFGAWMGLGDAECNGIDKQVLLPSVRRIVADRSAIFRPVACRVCLSPRPTSCMS